MLATRTERFDPQSPASWLLHSNRAISDPHRDPGGERWDMDTPGHRALRKGRFSAPGQVYLVTVVCKDRQRRFSNFDHACAVSRVLAHGDSWRSACLLAWVLMPDHWHALVQLGEEPLASVMQRVNSLTARAANRSAGKRGQVWQSAYHDHALRSEESLRLAARYLVANPLRAGLVERIGDYPFWNAVWLDGETQPLSP